jgi:membrane associated rhomboid family serine protease
MLDDRSYMRDPMYGSRRSMTLTIIIVLAICFVIQNLVAFYGRIPVDQYFGLTKYSITRGWLWQFFTFNFLHAPFGAGGFFHILFNCWAIWVFGHAVEEAIGPKRLLSVFIATGVGGGLFQVLGMLALPSHFGGDVGGRVLSVVGASAGVFGLIAMFAALFPARQLTLLLFFIIPVTITAKFLLIFSAAVSIFGILIPSGPVAHGAHLGGLLAGLAIARWGLQADWSLPKIRVFKRAPKVFVHKQGGSNWSSQKQVDPEIPSEEFISREVDPILDKISAHGIQSLTERERKILEAARAKMARR